MSTENNDSANFTSLKTVILVIKGNVYLRLDVWDGKTFVDNCGLVHCKKYLLYNRAKHEVNITNDFETVHFFTNCGIKDRRDKI